MLVCLEGCLVAVWWLWLCTGSQRAHKELRTGSFWMLHRRLTSKMLGMIRSRRAINESITRPCAVGISEAHQPVAPTSSSDVESARKKSSMPSLTCSPSGAGLLLVERCSRVDVGGGGGGRRDATWEMELESESEPEATEGS